MEYEIGDDPQGAADQPEARRDGGLRERLVFRKGPRMRAGTLDEDEPLEQLGELA
jgi:hypothetical protein